MTRKAPQGERRWRKGKEKERGEKKTVPIEQVEVKEGDKRGIKKDKEDKEDKEQREVREVKVGRRIFIQSARRGGGKPRDEPRGRDDCERGV